MRIDHVLYAVADLDDAGRTFERRHGLRSYPGGNHPAFGTGNRIIPLGDAYLELIAVTDPAVAGANPLGQRVAAAAASGAGWLGWVVAVDDLDDHARRRDTVVVPGHRLRPDGLTVSWRAAGMERMLDDPALPFFIAWDDETLHPGRRDPQPDTIGWIEVGADGGALSDWLGVSPPWLRLSAGDPRGVRAVGVGGRRIEE